MKKLMAGLVLVSVALFGAAGCGSDANAGAKEIIEVSLGKSPSSASEAESHNITLKALKGGERTFEVVAESNAKYLLTLTPAQVKELLDGTSVMADTTSGDMKVVLKITKEKDEGW